VWLVGAESRCAAKVCTATVTHFEGRIDGSPLRIVIEGVQKVEVKMTMGARRTDHGIWWKSVADCAVSEAVC
jgi:uncharacterized metal-binding protein